MAKTLVIGSESDVGRAIAVELSSLGYDVIASASNLTALDGMDAVTRVELDVTDQASVLRAREAIGDLDILVNTAGATGFGPLESMPLEEVRALYESNVFGVLRTVQAFAPGMRERRSGVIVNISSMLGRIASPLSGAYASTKWALEGLSETLRFELNAFGVKVLLIEPGFIGSEVLESRHRVDPQSPYARLARNIKCRTSPVVTPEAVARTVAEAIERGDDQFRFQVGREAEVVLDARSRLRDDLFEEVMRERFAVHWRSRRAAAGHS